MRIFSGVVDKYIYFVAVDATDLKTREPGLSSFTVQRSRNGAAEVAYTSPTITEIDASNMPGVYALLVDEDTTLDAGDDSQEYCVHITHAGMHPVTRTIEITRPKITAGNTLSVSSGGLVTLISSAGIKKNAAKAAFPFRMTDSTTHQPVTGLTVTATRSLDGAAFGACANAVAEVSNGWYKIDLAAGDLNGDTVALKFTATGADQLDIAIVTGA